MDKISWRTVEYFHTEKTNDWYWIVGIVSVSLAIISIILNNVIFGILIIVSAFTLSLFASKKPNFINVSLDNSGILFGKTFYPYSNLGSFWIETRDNHPRILLKSKKALMPYIVIFTEEENIDEIRNFLLNYLREEEHTEPLLEKILLYLGF